MLIDAKAIAQKLKSRAKDGVPASTDDAPHGALVQAMEDFHDAHKSGDAHGMHKAMSHYLTMHDGGVSLGSDDGHDE